MTKSLAASQKLMKTYLSELLTEEHIEEDAAVELAAHKPLQEKVLEKENLDKLLQQVVTADKVIEKPLSRKSIVNKPIEKQLSTQAKEVQKASVENESKIISAKINKRSNNLKTQKDKSYRKGSFQAMFFDVAGLIVAVPLIELGGIHNLDKTNSLMGKPDWFKGVMIHREEQINVVDTALWVMPEKCDQKLKDSLNYMYIIMLSNSRWGLTAEKLVDTVTLNQDDVKWLDEPSKRPWLAGLVKDRMCALLEVESLIELLNDGFNVNTK